MALITAAELERTIRTCLTRFYKRRIAGVDALDLGKILGRKNPYLFRAIGIQNAHEMITQLLAAHLSSSDEGMFGDEFFEPICRAVLGAGTVAAVKGADFIRETETDYQVIALKSGPNIFNSSQVAKQANQFDEIAASLRATLRSMRKAFVPIMGCGYGRVDSSPTAKRNFYKLGGQAFWEKLTDDANFYLKLVRFMKTEPERHRAEIESRLDMAENRLVGEFTARFCAADGSIQWDELVRFNSGKPTRRRSQTARRAE
jgi:hypothetical protein